MIIKDFLLHLMKIKMKLIGKCWREEFYYKFYLSGFNSYLLLEIILKYNSNTLNIAFLLFFNNNYKEMNNKLLCVSCSQQNNTSNNSTNVQNQKQSICKQCASKSTPLISEQIIGNKTTLENKSNMSGNINQTSKNIVLAQLISRRSSHKKQQLNSSFDQNIQKDSQNSNLYGIQHSSMDQSRQKDHQQINEFMSFQNVSLQQTNKIHQMCKLHQRPLQIVCIKDLTKICSSCALFGSHKGHQFKHILQVCSDKQNYYNLILNMMEKKQETIYSISDEKTKAEIFGILNIRKQNLIKQINSRFNELYDQIKHTQLNVLKKCDQIIEGTKQKLNDFMKLDNNLEVEIQKWDTEAYQVIKILQGNDYSKLLEIIYYGGNCITQNGHKVNEKLKKQEEELLLNVEKTLDVITIEKNNKIFENLPTFTTICQKKLYEENQFIFSAETYSSENISFDFENQCEDSLLDFDFGQLNRTQVFIEQSSHCLKQSQISKISDLKKSQASANTAVTQNFKKNINVKNVETVQSHQSSVNSQDKAAKTKLVSKIAKLKLPQKCQKVVNAISNDTLDLVDLTNAQLGDNTILQISKLIAGTNKIKAIKFIRNKLSDECIKKILPFMSNVITLNLSQNYLTEQTLDYIADNIAKLPKLKSLILSQNKIIERKHKPRIEKLRKLGLIVSV